MYEFSLNDPHFLPHAGGNVNFTLSAGNGLVVVGENGIGKSSLAQRFAMDLAKPDSLAFIPQLPLTVFYERTLKVFLSLFSDAAGSALNEKRLTRLVEEFGLIPKSERPLSYLSGGEAQCLKLITGLSLRKELYILDEPSQYLDSAKKETLRNILWEIRGEGCPLFLVEHDWEWLGSGWKMLELKSHEGQIKVGREWTI